MRVNKRGCETSLNVVHYCQRLGKPIGIKHLEHLKTELPLVHAHVFFNESIALATHFNFL